jgi:hypothetical protein
MSILGGLAYAAGRVCEALPIFRARVSSWLAAAVLLSGWFWCIHAQADGVARGAIPTASAILGRRTQSAEIWLSNGQEHLLLAVNGAANLPAGAASELVWITPVSAPASLVRADILQGFETFSGIEATEAGFVRARRALAAMLMTQLWPIPAALPTLSVRQVAAPITLPARSVQRQGVALGVVDAASLDALEVRLRAWGVSLSESTRRSLAPYLSTRGSLVTYRINDPAAARQVASSEGLGITLTFPADGASLPLLVSATAPETNIDITVIAIGFFQSPGAGLNGLRTSYFLGGPESSGSTASELQNWHSISSRFTRFEFRANPASLASSLSLTPGAPRAVLLAADLCERSGALAGLAVALTLFCSFAAGAALTMRFVWPLAARPSRKKVAVIGLLNVATLIAPLIASLLLARRLGVSRIRALAFVAASSVTLTLAIVAFTVALRLLRA